MGHSLILIFNSAFLIITGALCFYTTSIVWDILSWLLQKVGLEPQRTHLWDAVILIYGVVALAAGLFGLYLLLKGR